jgi:hypothetical protein
VRRERRHGSGGAATPRARSTSRWLAHNPYRSPRFAMIGTGL